MNAFEELRWRGFVYDHTDGVPELLAKEKITLYNGFDPTGDSLHIGHLVPMMAMARMQRYGHTPIALAGGGTGMVGDPSGRSTERNLLTLDEVQANLVRVQEQLSGVLDFEVKSNPARIVNNAHWLTELSMMEFLRDVGKHFTINYMMAKDSVKSRHRVRMASPTPSSATCCCKPTTSCTCSKTTTASCKWAAATSGATF
jgi:tyrosyl-tRNA synthetase